jgi:acylphosphatase
MKIIVKGKVQGVSYRYYTKKKAEQLGIKGYVKNLDNGDVEIVAQGKNLKEFIEWCREGPPAANVKEVKTKQIKTKNYKDFRILFL